VEIKAEVLQKKDVATGTSFESVAALGLVKRPNVKSMQPCWLIMDQGDGLAQRYATSSSILPTRRRNYQV
jgi:hypothetical protein